jgi:hypothetical protein
MRGVLALATLLLALSACGNGGQHVTAAAAVSTPCPVAGSWNSDGSGGEFSDAVLTISPDCKTATGTNSLGTNTYSVSKEDSPGFYDLDRQDGARFVATLLGPNHLQVREQHGLTGLGPVSMLTTASSANAISAPVGAEAPTDAKGRPAPGTQAFCKAALRDVNNATALRRLTGREPKFGVDWGIWSDADSLASDYENAGMFAGDTKGLQESLAADTKALRTDCDAN